MQKLKQEENDGIGQNLKRLRLRKKLKQTDVVRELDFYGFNISRITYSKMEHNNYAIRINELMALKLIFECDFEDFFKGVGYPKRVV